jgi:hypothetical protein
MDEDLLESTTLEASIADPNDRHEVTMQADAVSVGVTDPLFGSGKRVKWTAELLKKFAHTFKNMPITAEIREDGKLVPHSKVTIGNISDAYFDEGTNKIVTDGILWNHYYPETIAEVKKLYETKDENGRSKAEVSWEFDPTELTASPEDGEDVWVPNAGRFAGLAIVAKGADLGQGIRLLASAMEKEQEAILNKAIEKPRPGTFEWIGSAIAEHLTAGADSDDYVPKEVVATYLDRAIYAENGRYFSLPYTIEGSDLKFSDTIEVEPTFQPLGASAAGSQTDPENTPNSLSVKEAEKPVDPKELATLQAAADRVPALETENSDLKAAKTTLEEENETLRKENETLKAANEEREREETQKTLAASRLEEVEKIRPYEDEAQKKEDFEAFKTMDDKAFEVVKRVLAASADKKGGVADEGRITPPEKTPQDPDGAAAAILESEEFNRLLASVSGKEEA